MMLFDGAFDALHRAKEGFKIESVRERNQIISNNLIKAQNIFTECQRSLKMEKGGKFPETMFQLYDFYTAKLNEANFRKEEAPIDTVIELFGEIREAWAEMLSKQMPKAKVVASARSSDGVGSGLSLRA